MSLNIEKRKREKRKMMEEWMKIIAKGCRF